MTEQSPDKPKIIVDEDWKSQVQKEKEALQQQQSGAAAGEGAPRSKPADQAQHQYPPATLPVLLSTLATEAMVALGQIPHPATNQPQVDLAGARHFIDTLEMLEQKTAGNRTPQESQMLERILHELRMVYVSVSG